MDQLSPLKIIQSLKSEDLLSLLSDKEIFLALLEHDRWKTEAKLANKLKIQELKGESRTTRGSYSPRRATPSTSRFSDEELEFNRLTSYDACGENHIGLIAKTKVWEGTNIRAGEIYSRWKDLIEQNSIVPLKDLKDGRIKTLLLYFLWASSCAHRANKWPEASDISIIESVKNELSEKFSKFSKKTIVSAYDSLRVFWTEINGQESVPFNSSFLAEILDEAYSYVADKKLEEEKSDIKKSPLFREFDREFPHVGTERLEKYYNKNNKNFKAAAVGALRRTFTEVLPEELSNEFTQEEWVRKWHMHVEEYQNIWSAKIDDLVQRNLKEQEQWNQE